MRTTLELPDDLMRSIKVRAASTDRTLTDVMTEVLRAGLRMEESDAPSRRTLDFPLVITARTAPEGALSPERIAEITSAADVDDLAS
jgi:plasmid stability protein